MQNFAVFEFDARRCSLITWACSEATNEFSFLITLISRGDEKLFQTCILGFGQQRRHIPYWHSKQVLVKLRSSAGTEGLQHDTLQ